MKSPIPAAMPLTPEWFAIRKYNPDSDRPVIFGASIAAAVCGLSKWKTPLHIYRDYCGLAEPQEDSVAMRMGRKLEPVVISEYVERTGNKVDAPLPCFLSAEHLFLSATPDGMIIDDGGEWKFPMDAKTASFRVADEFGEEFTDSMPVEYLVQAQAQMLVMGCDMQETAVLLDGRTLRIYRVYRNEILQDAIIDAGAELAQRIVSSDPPEPTWTHPQTNSLVKVLYGIEESKTIFLSDETALFREQYNALGHQIKELEAQREELHSRILYVMEDAHIGKLPGGKELVRSKVERKEYLSPATSYISLRERKEPKKK